MNVNRDSCTLWSNYHENNKSWLVCMKQFGGKKQPKAEGQTTKIGKENAYALAPIHTF